MIKWSFLGPGTGNKSLPLNIDDFKKLYTGNTGNLVYYFATQCVTRCEGGSYGVGSNPEVLNKLGNGLILSMANHLGGHTDLSIDGMKLDAIKVPMVALGLGAQVKESTNDLSYIPKGTKDWLSKLALKSPTTFPNITVRGDYTLQVMEKLGLGDNVISLGCQSNFINPTKDLGKSIKHFMNTQKIEKISIAAGNPFQKDLRKLESSLLLLAVKTRGEYIIQHPLSFIQLATNFSDEEFNDAWNKIAPAYKQQGIDEDIFLDAIKNNFKVFTNVPQWIGNHRHNDVVVGTRIHGVQSALQAGRPAICLYIDSRTEELCKKMKIPCASAKKFLNGISLEDIYKILNNWDYEEYDQNRLFLARTLKTFLQNNGIALGKSLEKLTL